MRESRILPISATTKWRTLGRLPDTGWPVSVGLILLLLSISPAPAAQPFRCGGVIPPVVNAAGKVAARSTSPHRAAILLFAHFADQDLPQTSPTWAADLLDPNVPGSVPHFYDTMSFGKLLLRGEVAPRRYSSPLPANAYLATTAGQPGQYGRFALDILRSADADIDFRRFDNDGPDGVPNSGDDDGLVDVLFLSIASAPAGFLLQEATGIADLGFDGYFLTNDVAADGTPIRIDPRAGMIQAVPDQAQAAGVMAHEYGHILGLPDLYNVQWTSDPSGPEQDSAGIGNWGLMGWGATGWQGAAGPNSLSAWSRQQLGWAQTLQPEGIDITAQLQQVGATGQLYRVPLTAREYLLLEYRRHSSTFYDRGIPAEGLLIWRINRVVSEGRLLAPTLEISLESADGRWMEAGYPLGTTPAPADGGDNLDFWAHDQAYATDHGGNLGDATDPFDGVLFSRYASDTNPAATSTDGSNSVTLEQIALDGDRLSLRIRTDPPALELRDVAPRSERVTAGTPLSILFQLANVGATPAHGLRAELHTEDDRLEILTPSLPLSSLPVGDSSIGGGISSQGFPRVRFRTDLDREHTAILEVVIYLGDIEMARAPAMVTGVPAHRLVAAIQDEAGTPLPGIRVRLTLAQTVAENLFYELSVRSDSAGVAEFFLPSGTYGFRAEPAEQSSWGLMSKRDVRVDRDTRVDLILPQTAVITGTVRDAGGLPVPNQLVIFDRDEGVSNLSRATTTDEQGAYSLKMPTNTYRVRTRTLGGAAALQSHGEVDLTLQTELDLTLAPGLRLTIDVVDASGTHIDGVRVVARLADDATGSSQLSAQTADGEVARLEVLPGTYMVTLDEVPPPNVAPATPTEVVVDKRNVSTRVVLPLGLFLTGRLLDSSGAVHIPQAEQTWVFFNMTPITGGRPYSTRLTPGPAQFTIGLLPGTYRAHVDVFASGDTDIGLPTQDLGIMEIQQDTTLAFMVSAGVLVSGRVHSRTFGTETRPELTLQAASGAFAFPDLAPDGTFSVRVTPDLYTIRLSFTGNESPPSQVLAVVDVTQDTLLEWHALEGDLVAGRLVDIHGDGVAGASLSAQTVEAQISNSSQTQADGTFDILLPAATYAVRASLAQAGLSVDWRLPDLEIPPLTPPVLVLPGGASLLTQISDSSDRPVPASVELFTGLFTLDSFLHQVIDTHAQVDAQLQTPGPHRIDLAPGRYHALVQPGGFNYPRYARVVPEVIAEAESELLLSLPPQSGEASLSGSILDAQDNAPAAAALFAFEPELAILSQQLVQGGRYELPLPAGVYHLAVLFLNQTGDVEIHDVGVMELRGDRILDIVLDGVPSVVTSETPLPAAYSLEQNYPNPFNADTVIELSTGSEGHVEVAIFDLLGQRVRTLLGIQKPAGTYQLRWDGRDQRGQAVATGVYLYRLTTTERTLSRKMLLLR